jgi:hypothetical protein
MHENQLGSEPSGSEFRNEVDEILVRGDIGNPEREGPEDVGIESNPRPVLHGRKPGKGLAVDFFNETNLIGAHGEDVRVIHRNGKEVAVGQP